MIRSLYPVFPLFLLLLTGYMPVTERMASHQSAPSPDDIAGGDVWNTVSMPARLDVKARAVAVDSELQSAGLSDSAGIGCIVSDSLRLTVERFAAFGHSDDPLIFDWVIRIADGTGTITGERVRRTDDQGNVREMYAVRFVGMMELTIKMEGARRPIPLRMREPARLRGYSESWPPYGAELSLEVDSVRFYHQSRVADSGVPPYARVPVVKLTFGERPTRFFATSPTITDARAVEEGARITWTPTVDAIHPLSLAGYNIYRTPNPSDRRSWRLVAQADGERTEAIDTTYDGRENAGYVVTHRLKYPIDFDYEGMPCRPFFLRQTR